MSTEAKSPITAAVLRILKPLVRILIRNGVAYGTLAELVRKTYVDVGFEIMSENGRRPTVSGVSGMTGLTRKETKRLAEMPAPDTAAADQRYNRAVRVISGWLNDAGFLDADGQPAVLPLEGAYSFSELVKRYSGDIPVAAMLSLLREANCVADTERGIALVAHAYIPHTDPEENINILGVDTAELIDTIDHNLSAHAGQLHFQRKVSNHAVRPEAVEEFKRLSASRSQALLEELDAWLSEHEESDPDKAAHYVALGIYYTERNRSVED